MIVAAGHCVPAAAITICQDQEMKRCAIILAKMNNRWDRLDRLGLLATAVFGYVSARKLRLLFIFRLAGYHRHVPLWGRCGYWQVDVGNGFPASFLL